MGWFDGFKVECPGCGEFKAAISDDAIITCGCGYNKRLGYSEGVRYKLPKDWTEAQEKAKEFGKRLAEGVMVQREGSKGGIWFERNARPRKGGMKLSRAEGKA